MTTFGSRIGRRDIVGPGAATPGELALPVQAELIAWAPIVKASGAQLG